MWTTHKTLFPVTTGFVLYIVLFCVLILMEGIKTYNLGFGASVLL
jgi:hypothetical protein